MSALEGGSLCIICFGKRCFDGLSETSAMDSDIEHVLDKVKNSFECVTKTKWNNFDVDKFKNVRRGPTLTVEDELKLYRDVMFLMKFKLDQDSRKAVSSNLSLLLVQEKGLFKLIMAVFDLEESSQKVTTLDQRFMAISNVICSFPTTCVPFQEYLELLAPQVHEMFLSAKLGNSGERKLMHFRKIATHVVNGFLTRNKKLAIKFLIQPVLQGFQVKQSVRKLSLDDCIDVIYGLIIGNFDVKYLVTSFPNLFYIRCVLDEISSGKKTKLTLILQEILKRMDNSIYLLDDCLFNHYQLINSYEIIRDEKDGSCHVVEKMEIEDGELDVKLIDTVNIVAVDLVESSLQNGAKVDFCFCLLDHMTLINVLEPSQGLLLCSFLATLQEKIQNLFPEFPDKFIRFVVTTLNRYRPAEVTSSNIQQDQEDEEKVFASLQNDSASIAVQILKIILSEKDKLDRASIITLKECIGSIEKIVELVKSVGKEAEEVVDISSLIQLKEEIVDLDPEKSYLHISEKKENLQQALRDLNDPLMPFRAHALVTIKHLIMACDVETINNKDRILELLKSSIADEESYIYLLAVNTLAALALCLTDQVLPVITALYLNDNRTVQEKIIVGEVIVQVTKNLGESAPHYSRTLMNCFYSGITHPEPIIRTSSISNIGQLCSILKFSLRPHISQLIIGIKCLIQTETDIEAKRAAIMLIHMILNGIDVDCIDSISDQLPEIYRLVKSVYNNSLDDVMQLHAQLAYEQLDRIGRNLLLPAAETTRKKKLIQVLD